MNRKKMLDNLDAIANQYHKTKDPYYKDLWYKKIKEIVNGINHTSGWDLQSDIGHERNDKSKSLRKT